MNTQYTAVVKEELGCWIGWIEEVPGVNCQEESREELIKTLQTTLREAIEFNADWKAYVATDVEFAKFFADAEFTGLVQ